MHTVMVHLGDSEVVALKVTANVDLVVLVFFCTFVPFAEIANCFTVKPAKPSVRCIR